jgi:hypothetical protein
MNRADEGSRAGNATGNAMNRADEGSREGNATGDATSARAKRTAAATRPAPKAAHGGVGS